MLDLVLTFLLGMVAGAIFHKAIAAWLAKKNITLPER